MFFEAKILEVYYFKYCIICNWATSKR